MRRSPSFRGALHGALLCAFSFSAAGCAAPGREIAPEPESVDPATLPASRPVGELEVVTTFHGPMPTGVTVSREGRVFVCFPRWSDRVDATVVEVRGNEHLPFPNVGVNRLDKSRPGQSLVCVQSVVVDGDDRLWLLDAGSVDFGPVLDGGPKLVCVDLRTDTIVRTIPFGPEVAPPDSYLNDVRFDLTIGEQGYAYLTDSSPKGDNALVVVDLSTGAARRVLAGHPSVKPDPAFLPLVEGRPMREYEKGREKPLAIGADGIALSQDGRFLYWCPLASRRLYRVPTEALRDPQADPRDVAEAIERLENRPFASDGLEHDAEGGLWLTDYEHNSVLRRDGNGRYETFVHDPRALWPDTLALGADGSLYFVANQLHRQARFQHGRDLREKPYVLFRVADAGTPVRLGGRR